MTRTGSKREYAKGKLSRCASLVDACRGTVLTLLTGMMLELIVAVVVSAAFSVIAA